VISWKDFVFDDVLGPVLAFSEVDMNESENSEPQSCRRKRLGSPSVKEDAMGFLIQETGQEKRPARMVGHSSLDSSSTAQNHMDVNSGDRAKLLRQRGES
jgi:hypothetical protein